MEQWNRAFLRRLEQELTEYREDSIFLEEEGENPDTLRQLFDLGEEKVQPVVMDIAIFTMEDGRQLLQIYTEIALEVEAEAVSFLLPRLNALNLPIPIGAFGYFEEERQLYHKYNQLVEEPQDKEHFLAQILEVLDMILSIVSSCYEELYGIAKEGKRPN